MGLQGDLLTVPLEARFAYDTERNTFFLNMEGMSLATLDEVESIGTEMEKRWAPSGKKVQMVVNYDNFHLAPDLADAYTLVRRLADHYYVRYTTRSPPR
jgi:propionate CoA-transferase